GGAERDGPGEDPAAGVAVAPADQQRRAEQRGQPADGEERVGGGVEAGDQAQAEPGQPEPSTGAGPRRGADREPAQQRGGGDGGDVEVLGDEVDQDNRRRGDPDRQGDR